jgi:hypothetical protein
MFAVQEPNNKANVTPKATPITMKCKEPSQAVPMNPQEAPAVEEDEEPQMKRKIMNWRDSNNFVLLIKVISEKAKGIDVSILYLPCSSMMYYQGLPTKTGKIMD